MEHGFIGVGMEEIQIFVVTIVVKLKLLQKTRNNNAKEI